MSRVPAPGGLRQVLTGRHPATRTRRTRKPDLESLTALPPFEELLRRPLGSAQARRRTGGRGYFWAFDADGSLRGDPRDVDLAPLYAILRASSRVNIEGASVFGDRLWLFHRGNRASAQHVAELASRR